MVQLSYTYDAMGRRTSKAVQSGTPTQFLYDGANAVQEVQGSTVNSILTGLGVDERFARNDATGRTYFLTDALNSTIALTDPIGAVKEQYSYDPYGNVTLSDTTTGFTNPYQYTGREAATAGLYYYRARYYSPLMGGFISEDPITFDGGQLSFYGYVNGDPASRIDPSGKCPWCIAGAIVGGVSGVVGAIEMGGNWQDAAIAGVIGAGSGFVIAAAAPLELGAFAAGGLSGGVGAFGNFLGQEVSNVIHHKSLTCVNVGAIIGDGLGAGLGGFLMVNAVGSTAAVIVAGANSGQLEATGAAIGQAVGGSK